MKQNRKTAFTLIELLVVIAIIALLAGILIPSAFKGVEMGRRASCANNLKGIGAALLNYANDHRGSLPEGESMTDVAKELYEGGYLTELRVWHCLSDKKDSDGTAFAVSKIDDFDSGKNCSYNYLAGYNLLATEEIPAQAPLAMDEDDNHGETFHNVLFLDGHVQLLKGDEAVTNMFSALKAPDKLSILD